MTDLEAKEKLRSLLAGLSDLEVRELSIKVLRQWRARAPSELLLQLHGALGREVVPLLCERKRESCSPDDVNKHKEPFITSLHEPWMAPVVNDFRLRREAVA